MNAFAPILASDLVVGKPLPWAVYDAAGVLLLNEGMTPVSQAQIDSIIARGPCRHPGGGASKRQSAVRRPLPPMGVGAHKETETAQKNCCQPIPFDDLALQPGEILQLHTALEVVGDSMPAVLMGYCKNQSIIVAPPSMNGKPALIKDGTVFNVKTFSGTCLFTFRTKVLISYVAPMPHLHLEYPKLVHATKIRKALRAVVDLPATLRNPETGHSMDVILKDLSVGGARLVLPEAATCEQGTQLDLVFRVQVGDELEEEIKGEVIVRTIESREAKNAMTHSLGVQFRELPKAARLSIMALVYRLQLRKG